MNIESHSFGTFVPPNAETLVIGTFPTHRRNRDFEFSYPNSSNSFWKIIEAIFPYTFINDKGNDAVDERKKIASINKFALTDMLSKAIREEDNSGDEQLIPIEQMDIFQILKDNPSIKRIILTSRSRKINAPGLFEKYILERKVQFFKSVSERIIIGSLEFENRNIKVFVPYSPSPRVIRRFGFESVKQMFQNSFQG